MTNPYVRFEGVEKSYSAGRRVVEALNLDVVEGEFLTLLGPSGSGKTTTLMMLAGFEQPDHGEIFVRGARVTPLLPQERGIGVVFQNYALFPNMTVQQNVAFPLTVRKVKKADIAKRVADALQIVQLSEYADRRPQQLSGGQQQRVALARALVFEPSLVLMDEPLGALDKQLRLQMQLEIRRLHERLGVTIIYVTHDQEEAMTMSDRIAVFNDGRIQQIGNPEEIYERPENTFVAKFIGENNLLRGVVTQIQGDQCLVDISAGASVRASCLPKLRPGQDVALSLRPERIACVTAGQEPFQNNVAVLLEDAIYVGSQTRLVGRHSSGQMVTAILPAKQSMPVSGANVTFGWQFEDCLALPV